MLITELLAELREMEAVREYIVDLLQDAERMKTLSLRMRFAVAHDTLQPIDFLRLLALDESGRPLLTDWQLAFVARHVTCADAFLQAIRIVADERDSRWLPEDPLMSMAAAGGVQ